LVALLLILSGCAGVNKGSVPRVEFISDIRGHTQDEIHASTKIWIAESFISSEPVIELDDREAGRVIGRAKIKFPCAGLACAGQHDWKLGFTMRVDARDDKFKVTYSNLTLSWPPFKETSGFEGPVDQSYMGQVRPALLKLAHALKKSIAGEKPTENW
jgi:hypothetical protein